MSDQDALWDRVYDSFKVHQIPGIDRTPQMALDRIAAKCIHLSFNDSNCVVQKKMLSLDDLRQLRTYHREDRPLREDGSIVVLVHAGQSFVIDGNKRVNKWAKAGSTEMRSVLIITPKGA